MMEQRDEKERPVPALREAGDRAQTTMNQDKPARICDANTSDGSDRESRTDCVVEHPVQRLVEAGVTAPAELDRYRNIDADTAAKLNFAQPSPGILISYLDLNGRPMIGKTGTSFCRLRHAPEHVPKIGHTYSTPPDQGSHMYFPSGLRAKLDAGNDLNVTEGEIKGSVLDALGLAAIALPGWTCWSTPGTDQLHPDWAGLGLAGRRVNLIPDLDGAFNHDIHVQIVKLVAALQANEVASVNLVKIPPVSSTKLGIDDYLALSQESPE
jgi:hypothetical protein